MPALSHAPMRSRMRSRMRLHVRPMGASCVLRTPETTPSNCAKGAIIYHYAYIIDSRHACKKVAESIKKVAESFVGSKIIAIFALTMAHEFVITGVSRLTGYREEISRPMPEAEAKERLQRELQSRKYIKYPAHTRLRVERCLPIQLTIKFDD